MTTTINAVNVHVITAPLSEPFGFSQGWVTNRNSVLVEILSNDGHSGWGESLCHGLQKPEIAASIIQNVYAPKVKGRNVSDIEVIWEELYNLTRPFGQGGAVVNALSGVDIALWDLWGKILGQPVSRLIGGRFREGVRPYVTACYRRKGGLYPQEGIVEAEKHIQDGFDYLKLKVGFGIDEDVSFIKTVREAFPGVNLMVDANCAYAVPTARKILERIVDYDLHFFEEPLPPEDLEGYRLLRSLGRVSIAAGENLLGKHACARWISGGVLDYLQPDICSSGGFTELKKISALCQAWNTTMIPHVWGSGVCLAATLPLIASLPPTPLSLKPIEPILEYDRSDHPFRSDLIFGALGRDADGMIPIPDKPGLGIEINREVLNRFSVS